MDLGCGDASRIIKLAKEHPNWKFVGVDMNPRPEGRVPRNVRLVQANFTDSGFKPPKADIIEVNFLTAWPAALKRGTGAAEQDAYIPNQISKWLTEKGVIMMRVFPSEKGTDKYKQKINDLVRYFKANGLDTKIVEMKKRTKGKKAMTFWERTALREFSKRVPYDQLMARKGKFHRRPKK